MLIRNEIDGDAPAIRAVVTEAMKLLPQATGTEAAIVDRLRADYALRLSLVAEDGGEVVGYLAASDARIGAVAGWGLIGPVAVLPSRHGEGIGSALMSEAILRLRAGCKGRSLSAIPATMAASGSGPFRACGWVTARPGSCRPCRSIPASRRAS